MKYGYIEEFFMENKQIPIIAELKNRIKTGQYQNFLPKTSDLALEFGVNIKTMSKAIAKMAAQNLLERKKHIGTWVSKSPLPPRNEQLIEVIFEGFTSIYTHPFWGGILDGLIFRLAHCGYRPVFNTLKKNQLTGKLDLSNFSLVAAEGRILLGIFDRRVFDTVQQDSKPYISACDKVSLPGVPQVTFDFTYGIQRAVDYLSDRNCRRIAFIGQVELDSDLRIPHKYPAYCQAMRNNGLADYIEHGHTALRPSGGINALKRIIAGVAPDALLVAHDTQLPEILAELERRNIKIPVIGCDGLSMEGMPPKRHMVRVPLFECGENIARQLVTAIRQKSPVSSMTIPAQFIMHGRSS